MFTSFHSTVGGTTGYVTMITAQTFGADPTTAIVTGAVAAFASHHVIDHIAEAGIFRSSKEALIVDIGFITGGLMLIGYAAFGWVIPLFMFLANLMDVIDKGLKMLGDKGKAVFPCHRAPPFQYWIHLSRAQTWHWNITSWVVFVFISILKGAT